MTAQASGRRLAAGSHRKAEACSPSFSPRPRADIEFIWAQVWATSGETVAERIVDQIERRAASLADLPLLGPARPDIADGARSLLVERWLILYRVGARAIEIVRVVDGARDLRKLG